MGEFFVHREPNDNELWLYSERGLLSYLIQHLLLQNPAPVLQAATNGRQTLFEASGAPFHHHVAIGEFQLGPKGFGSPDGGFLGIHENGHKVFVFIEAKAVLENASCQDPAAVAARVAGLPWETVDERTLEKLIEDNTFNSSLNGQVELRWRFVNAFQQGSQGPEMRITEQAVPSLPPDLQSSDRFYWRRRLRPQRDVPGDWRRVNMRESKATNLLPLYEQLHGPNTRFFLLAITPDTAVPAALRSARLFTPTGDGRVAPEQFVFWLPLRFISDQLRRP